MPDAKGLLRMAIVIGELYGSATIGTIGSRVMINVGIIEPDKRPSGLYYTWLAPRTWKRDGSYGIASKASVSDLFRDVTNEMARSQASLDSVHISSFINTSLRSPNEDLSLYDRDLDDDPTITQRPPPPSPRSSPSIVKINSRLLDGLREQDKKGIKAIGDLMPIVSRLPQMEQRVGGRETWDLTPKIEVEFHSLKVETSRKRGKVRKTIVPDNVETYMFRYDGGAWHLLTRTWKTINPEMMISEYKRAGQVHPQLFVASMLKKHKLWVIDTVSITVHHSQRGMPLYTAPSLPEAMEELAGNGLRSWLLHVRKTKAAKTIQRRWRSSPHTLAGRRNILRRGGFDPNDTDTMRLAVRGVDLANSRVSGS